MQPLQRGLPTAEVPRGPAAPHPILPATDPSSCGAAEAEPGALRPVPAAARRQAVHTSRIRSPWNRGSSSSHCSPPCLVPCSIFFSEEFVVVRRVRSGVFAPLCKLSLGSHCRAVLFLPHTSLPIIISFLNKRNLEALAFLPCK